MPQTMRRHLRTVVTFLAAIALTLTGTASALATTNEELSPGLTDYGPLATGRPNMQQAAFSVEDGVNVAYLTSNRASGDTGYSVLSVIDRDSETLLRSRVLPGVTGIERIHVAADGNVYMSAVKQGGNALWQYSPDTTEVREVAAFSAYGRQITSDEQSVVFLAAHGGLSKAQLITFDPRTEQTDQIVLADAPTARAATYTNGFVYTSVENGADKYLVKYETSSGTTTRIEGSEVASPVNTMTTVGNWLVVLDGASLRFLNLQTEQWASSADGAELTIPGIFFGETEARDGKAVVVSDGKFVVIDGTDNETVSIEPSTISFGAAALRGVQWNDAALDSFVTVQNSGHISNFTLSTGVQSNTNPLQQNVSYVWAGIGQTSTGLLYAANDSGTTSAILNPIDGAVSVGGELPAFVASLPFNGSDYLLTAAGEVLRANGGSSGESNRIFTAADGASVAALVVGDQEVHLLVNQQDSAQIVSYAPENGQTSTVDSISGPITSGVSVQGLLYVSQADAAGASILAVDEATHELTDTVEVTHEGARVANISALSADSHGVLWAVCDGALVTIDPSTGIVTDRYGLPDELGTQGSDSAVSATWYGSTVFIGLNGGIASYSADEGMALVVSPDAQIFSWEIWSGAESAALFALSSLNPANLLSMELEWDPEVDSPGNVPGDEEDGSIPGIAFGDPMEVGVPVMEATIIDMAFGEFNGRTVGYTATSSDGSLLNMIDVESNEFIQSAPMPSVIQAWKLEVAANGKVYVAAIGRDENGHQQGELWIYDPETNDVEFAGAIPGAKSAWSMTTDQDSNAYIGVYDSGQVVHYDAATGVFTQWGRLEDQEYVRSIKYYDGHIYAGTGVKGSVVKINVDDPEDRVRISDPLLEIFDVAGLPWAYDMQTVDNWLLVNFTGDLAATAFYNLETGEWSPTALTKEKLPDSPTQNGNPGFTQLAPRDGAVYLTFNGALTKVDLSGEAPTFIATSMKVGVSQRGQAWADLSEQGYDGEWLVTATRAGTLLAFNPDTNENITLPSVIQTDSGTPLHTLMKNADDNLYFVTYPARNGAEYNTSTGKFQQFPAEQAESMLTVGDTTYFGIYPGGHIQKVTKDQVGRPAVEHLFTIGEEQDRPYYMTESDGLIYIGSIADYERHPGALTIYDPATGDYTVKKGIVEDQGVIGLAVKDGTVWGSTTIHGGLGIAPVATEAKLFTYDVETDTKTGEFSLDLPDGQRAKHISALSFGPDGNIWGTADGYLFVLNPETMELIPEKTINFFPEITQYGMWRPMSFEWYEGLLFINVASKTMVIDPETMASRMLTDYDEEIARFAIAPLSPEILDEAGLNTRAAEEGPNVKIENGIYFFGKAAPDTLRVIPLIEDVDQGTDEPGTDEPGTDEPGTDEPGTDEPGIDKEPGPGKEPGVDKEPGADKPGTDKEPGESSGLAKSGATVPLAGIAALLLLGSGAFIIRQRRSLM